MRPSPSAHHLPPQDLSFDELASLTKAAGDPLRLEILRVLRSNSFGVLELCHILDVKQSALSHHLKVLAQAQLLSTRREGNSIFYHRSHFIENAYYPLQQALFQTIDQQALNKQLLQRIQYIQKERAARSKLFFREHAEIFEQQQERIATFSAYKHALLGLLPTHASPVSTALEVGPGFGECLSELSTRFGKVVALDNSREMLDRARQHCESTGANKVTFVYGDTAQAVKKNIRADCVVLNMVLHHTPSPAEMFDDLFQLLNVGGCLLVTEICRHQQDWVKQACGDLWLGFETEELLQWAQHAGFAVEQSLYQALRNGFQIQMHRLSRPAMNQHSH